MVKRVLNMTPGIFGVGFKLIGHVTRLFWIYEARNAESMMLKIPFTIVKILFAILVAIFLLKKYFKELNQKWVSILNLLWWSMKTKNCPFLSIIKKVKKNNNYTNDIKRAIKKFMSRKKFIKVLNIHSILK